MRLPRLSRAHRPADDATDATRLLDAARSGDEAALAALRADLDAAALAPLAALLGVPCDPVADPAAVLLAARTRPDLLEPLVVLLLDGGGRSPAVVAELLDATPADVLAARERGLARSGGAAPPPGCRGWLLVARTDRLTPAEQSAAAAHLADCRRCEQALAAGLQARRRLPAPRTGSEPR